jgi:hypothetical protein
MKLKNPTGVAAFAMLVLSAALVVSLFMTASYALFHTDPVPCQCSTDSDCAARCGGNGDPELSATTHRILQS